MPVYLADTQFCSLTGACCAATTHFSVAFATNTSAKNASRSTSPSWGLGLIHRTAAAAAASRTATPRIRPTPPTLPTFRPSLGSRVSIDGAIAWDEHCLVTGRPHRRNRLRQRAVTADRLGRGALAFVVQVKSERCVPAVA